MAWPDGDHLAVMVDELPMSMVVADADKEPVAGIGVGVGVGVTGVFVAVGGGGTRRTVIVTLASSLELGPSG